MLAASTERTILPSIITHPRELISSTNQSANRRRIFLKCGATDVVAHEGALHFGWAANRVDDTRYQHGGW